MSDLKKPWEMEWYGAEFSSVKHNKLIKVAHNFEDDEIFKDIFKIWVRDAKVIDAQHFCDYVTTLRTAGMIPYYVIPFEEFVEIMKESGIEPRMGEERG